MWNFGLLLLFRFRLLRLTRGLRLLLFLGFRLLLLLRGLGLLLFLGLSLLLLLWGLGLLLLFRLSLLLLFCWSSLFLLLLLPCASGNGPSQKQKHSGYTNRFDLISTFCLLCSTVQPPATLFMRAQVFCSIFIRWARRQATAHISNPEVLSICPVFFNRVCYPTRTWDMEWNNPNTLPSHHKHQ